MPAIKIKHVVSFSSEDKSHPADNLLKDETYRRWVCSSAGEKQAFVILQFEKAVKIHSIDIGNYGSAFIEVLVGRSDVNQDYQVILVASSFMTPRESRSNTNLSRVRMFETDKLNQTIADQKWDRVKIVCTQPFNKLIQYGISFVRFHSSPETASGSPSKATALKQTTLNIGPFKLKGDDENATDDLKPGSLFARRKDKPESPTLTGAAAVRAASVAAEEALKANSSPKVSQEKNKRPRLSIENNKPPSTKKPKIQPKSPKENNKQKEEQRPAPIQKKENKTPAKKMTSSESQNKNIDKKKTKSFRKRPFNKLMEGVVFTISGFQNPYRSEMRDRAIEMGAKYIPDWDKTCTHLVCAFVNTPKFVQVQGKGGKIVKKDWIEECYKAKELLPWKKFRLGDGGGRDSSDDTEEIEDDDNDDNEPLKNEAPKKLVLSTSPNKSPIKQGKSPVSKPSTSTKLSMSDDDYEGSTEVESNNEADGDTEDEIERIRENETKAKDNISVMDTDDDNAYDADTDVEDMSVEETVSKPDTSSLSLPVLPDYFDKKHFFLYGEFDEQERRLITRYITAFKGMIHQYMDEDVSYVITKAQWDENFDEALNDNSNLVFVKPKWIFACSDKQRLVPHQPYVVVPSTD